MQAYCVAFEHEMTDLATKYLSLINEAQAEDEDFICTEVGDKCFQAVFELMQVQSKLRHFNQEYAREEAKK